MVLAIKNIFLCLFIFVVVFEPFAALNVKRTQTQKVTAQKNEDYDTQCAKNEKACDAFKTLCLINRDIDHSKSSEEEIFTYTELEDIDPQEELEQVMKFRKLSDEDLEKLESQDEEFKNQVSESTADLKSSEKELAEAQDFYEKFKDQCKKKQKGKSDDGDIRMQKSKQSNEVGSQTKKSENSLVKKTQLQKMVGKPTSKGKGATQENKQAALDNINKVQKIVVETMLVMKEISDIPAFDAENLGKALSFFKKISKNLAAVGMGVGLAFSIINVFLDDSPDISKVLDEVKKVSKKIDELDKSMDKKLDKLLSKIEGISCKAEMRAGIVMMNEFNRTQVDNIDKKTEEGSKEINNMCNVYYGGRKLQQFIEQLLDYLKTTSPISTSCYSLYESSRLSKTTKFNEHVIGSPSQLLDDFRYWRILLSRAMEALTFCKELDNQSIGKSQSLVKRRYKGELEQIDRMLNQELLSLFSNSNVIQNMEKTWKDSSNCNLRHWNWNEFAMKHWFLHYTFTVQYKAYKKDTWHEFHRLIEKNGVKINSFHDKDFQCKKFSFKEYEGKNLINIILPHKKITDQIKSQVGDLENRIETAATEDCKWKGIDLWQNCKWPSYGCKHVVEKVLEPFHSNMIAVGCVANWEGYNKIRFSWTKGKVYIRMEQSDFTYELKETTFQSAEGRFPYYCHREFKIDHLTIYYVLRQCYDGAEDEVKDIINQAGAE